MLFANKIVLLTNFDRILFKKHCFLEKIWFFLFVILVAQFNYWNNCGLLIPGCGPGHYVPQLSQAIVRYNHGVQKQVINLKGFLVCMLVSQPNAHTHIRLSKTKHLHLCSSVLTLGNEHCRLEMLWLMTIMIT